MVVHTHICALTHTCTRCRNVCILHSHTCSFLQRVKRTLVIGNCLTSAVAEHAMTTNHAIGTEGHEVEESVDGDIQGQSGVGDGGGMEEENVLDWG